MNIPKAIEILSEVIRDYPDQLWDDANNAIALSIEALKKIKSQREPNGTLDFFKLPGETEN